MVANLKIEKVLKLFDFAVVTFLGTGATWLLKQVIDALQSWCICIKRAQDRKCEALSFVHRAWCADFEDFILGKSVKGKLASVTLAYYSDKGTFHTQEATSCPVEVHCL